MNFKLLISTCALFYANFTFAELRNYSDVQKSMNQIVADHPDTTEKVIIGKNDQYISIKGLKIGKGASAYVVVGTHHGDERSPAEVAVALSRSLAKNPIPGRTVYIIPVLNISGYNDRTRNETLPVGQSTDPNRDYDNPCKTISSRSWQLASIKKFAEFLAMKSIIGLITLHNDGRQVAFPWSNKFQTYTKDHQKYKDLSQLATDLNRYQSGTYPDMAYSALGTLEDYAYWKHGIWSFLFEMGDVHFPGPIQMENDIKENVPAIIALIEGMPKTRSSNHDYSAQCDPVKSSGIFDLQID